jgi:hypothetical protein
MDSENQPAEYHHGHQRVQSVPYHPVVGRADEVVISFHLLVEAFEHTLFLAIVGVVADAEVTNFDNKRLIDRIASGSRVLILTTHQQRQIFSKIGKKGACRKKYALDLQ